uniref:Uncharacterized protein n=1 Tax=Arundo donax TaxID=35708 RepID=A0A0A8YLU4_ARUDO
MVGLACHVGTQGLCFPQQLPSFT